MNTENNKNIPSASMRFRESEKPTSPLQGAVTDRTEAATRIPLHQSEVQRLQDLLRQKQDSVAQLMNIWEEERTIVAREIHENLAQMLAALQMNVSLIALEYADHVKLVARTKTMDQLITSSMSRVQRISSELRPAMLDLLGITDAMECHVKEFQKKAGIPCLTLFRLGENNVDRDVSTTIFRIFQEALNNVIQHSGATRVQVELVERKGWLTLSVRDDGRGIAEQDKSPPLFRGITWMRERAKASGGKLRIFSSPQHGTSLFARIPLGGK